MGIKTLCIMELFNYFKLDFNGFWEYINFPKEELIFVLILVGSLIFLYLLVILFANFFIKIGKWWRDFKEFAIRDSHKTLGR